MGSDKRSTVPHAPKPNRAAKLSQARRLDGCLDAGLEAASDVRGSAIH